MFYIIFYMARPTIDYNVDIADFLTYEKCASVSIQCLSL